MKEVAFPVQEDKKITESIKIKDRDPNLCDKEMTEKDLLTEKLLVGVKILAKKDDIYEFNLDALKKRLANSNKGVYGHGVGGEIWISGRRYYINHKDILNFLYKIKGYDINDDKKEIKPILNIPRNLHEAKQGGFSEGLYFPWDVFNKQIFHTKFKLDDNSEVGLADLFYLQKIKELKFRKDKDGDVEYFDKEKNCFTKFKFYDNHKIFGRIISFIDDSGLNTLESRPDLFLNKFIPVVGSLNLFNESQRRQAGGKQSEILFSHERKLNKSSTVYANFFGEEVGSIGYYIGRNKVVGTNREKSDSLSAVELDKDTVGITENKYGKIRLLYTFDKISKKEFYDFGFDKKKKDFRQVGGEEMKKRIKEYNVSDYVNQGPEESAKDYADRLSRLNDVSFITKDFRNMMASKFIALSQFSWTEQILIANYILETENKKEFLDFIEKYREDGLRSFLVAEADISMAKKVVKIGNNFSEKPDIIKNLFSKYSDFSKRINENVEELNSLYQEVFFDKNINKNKLINILLSRANQLLISAHDKIEGLSKEEAEKEIKILIKQLDDEIENKFKNISELKVIADDLNKKYPEIMSSGLSFSLPSDNEFFEAIEKEENVDIAERVKQDFYKHKKFSSERLREIINIYQQMADLEYHDDIVKMVHADYKKIKATKNINAINDFDWTKKMEEYSKENPDLKSTDKEAYEKIVLNLKKVLPLQTSLENKLDQLVYGYDLAMLPDDFAKFEDSGVSPEKIPDKAPLFFPVGISKDLPSWEKVLGGEMKFAKPIDMYGYLFWLNNQNRKVDLIVCDEIQVENYQLRYGRDKEESRNLALKIGQEEANNYQKIIDTFGLDNIEILKYKDFLNLNKEKFYHYSKIVEKLKNHPIFKDMFLSMVQESVSGAEKEEYLGYANEELAWILSTDGTKVGHLNEARYDILAVVIRNLELSGEKLGVDPFNNLDDKQALSILQSVVRNIKDTINEEKSKLDKKSSPFLYYQRLQEHLNKINIDKKVEANKDAKKSDMVLNFSCPDVGSASFGWRGGLDKKESAVKFKEPYSTYFYKSKEDLLINSDQVVALGDGYISGKILTLDSSQQVDYAKRVIKPMLNHYLSSLNNAPANYFEKINKNKEELLAELKKCQSLLDTLKFIQKYIIKPVE